MKTVTINVYEFKELSEEAQQKALANYRHYQVDYNWWECAYNDANTVGLKIEAFDTYRKTITIKYDTFATDVALKICDNHGEKCETYLHAKVYLKAQSALVEKLSDGIDTDRVAEQNDFIYDNLIDPIESAFLDSLGHCYIELLEKEYDFLTSDESLTEFFEANEYEFNQDGSIF